MKGNSDINSNKRIFTINIQHKELIYNFSETLFRVHILSSGFKVGWVTCILTFSEFNQFSFEYFQMSAKPFYFPGIFTTPRYYWIIFPPSIYISVQMFKEINPLKGHCTLVTQSVYIWCGGRQCLFPASCKQPFLLTSGLCDLASCRSASVNLALSSLEKHCKAWGPRGSKHYRLERQNKPHSQNIRDKRFDSGMNQCFSRRITSCQARQKLWMFLNRNVGAERRTLLDRNRPFSSQFIWHTWCQGRV